jgi:hypothetical protein
MNLIDLLSASAQEYSKAVNCKYINRGFQRLDRSDIFILNNKPHKDHSGFNESILTSVAVDHHCDTGLVPPEV